MKTLLGKLTVPMALCLFINIVGFLYHKNYEGAVVGSVVGMIIAFLALEIRAKFD